MKIPQEYLTEKNYEGARLIEITDEKVAELNKELKALQAEANPILAVMEKMTPAMDPLYTKLRDLEAQKTAVKEELDPLRVPFDAEMEKLTPIEQKAQLIKTKMQTIINSLVSEQIGELERANQMIEKDGKLYVEVLDEVEEAIKATRAKKMSQKKITRTKLSDIK